MDSRQNLAFQYLRVKDLNGLKQSFSLLSTEERGRIVNEKIDGKCAFFSACESGELDFVNFMLNECDAGIAINGSYTGNAINQDLEVPPLWAAAAQGKLDIVKTLVEHHASVNATSNTGTVPLSMASYEGYYELVGLLIQNGADVNSEDDFKSVPLAYAIYSNVALCEMLINNGASVNVQDVVGFTPLTHAVKNGRLDLVKLFVCNGGDCNIKTVNGDNVLRIAASCSTGPILDYLIQRNTLKKIEIVEAYELFGCTLADTYNDLEMALFVWGKAMSIRDSVRSRPIQKSGVSPSHDAYNGFVEPTSLVAYHRVWNGEDIYMNALVVRERILGKSHRYTTDAINYRATMYYEQKNYKRCLELWKYSYGLECDSYPATDWQPIWTAQTLVCLFYAMESELHAQLIDMKAQTSDFLQTFKLVVKQLEGGLKELKVRPLEEHTQGHFNWLMTVVLHFINYRCNMELNDCEETEFLLEVRKLVQSSPKTEKGNTLLHEAMLKGNSTANNQFCSHFPSSGLIEVLVENGVSVNSANDSLDTALHLLIEEMSSDEADDEREKILTYLLKKNVHLDVYNDKGFCILTWLLENRQYPVCSVRDRTLACLAAKAIVDNRIPFEVQLSPSQVEFVKSHGWRG